MTLNRWNKTSKFAVVGVAILLTSAILPNMITSAESLVTQTGPQVERVTASSEDLLYNKPIIDSETDVKTPVAVRRVSGHFEGTDKKFTFYFPPKEQWDGRFFQMVYPLADEHATNETISFGVDSGAYTVQTNSGSGYRVDAAAAKFSKIVAAKYYNWSEPIYGYIWGGSGGSFMTVGAIENTSGVWDGAVPFITGLETSLPNYFFARAFSRFVLEEKAPLIADAVSPGRDGDPYSRLNDSERSVLREVSRLGIPLRGWEDYSYLLGYETEGGLLGNLENIRSLDPSYADDFWSKDGYLGTEQSVLGNKFRASKVDKMVDVTSLKRDPLGEKINLTLEEVPSIPSFPPAEFTLYKADGKTRIGLLKGEFNELTSSFTIDNEISKEILDALNGSVKVRIDNRWTLAVLSYHRHQVPQKSNFYAWDQFRTKNGTPIYPQRAIELGSLTARSITGGAKYTGKLQSKVIMVGNLLDVDAYPCDSDWYSERVREALGSDYNKYFRIWYNDNADHIENGPRTPRIVQFDGIIQQALRDVSAWVEKGISPPPSSRYQVVDSQVILPESAVIRQGIQPVVDLTVNGEKRVEIHAGQKVNFKAKIQVPHGAGQIVETAWDIFGTGDFQKTQFQIDRNKVEISKEFTFKTPGVYNVSIRATSQREGNKNTPFTKIQNLGRVRVVVK